MTALPPWLASALLACALSVAGTIPAIAQQAPQQQQQQQRPPANRPAQQRPPQPAPQPEPQQQAQPQPLPQPPLPTELPPAGTQFVILDGRYVMTQSLAAQQLRQQGEQHQNALRADVQKQEQEFKNAQNDLQRQRAGLSAEAFEARVRDLQKRMSDAQNRLQTRTRNLERAFGEAEGKVYQAMVQAAVEVAQERNYLLILDKAQVVVVQSQLEITAEILNRVNQRLASVPLQIVGN